MEPYSKQAGYERRTLEVSDASVRLRKPKEELRFVPGGLPEPVQVIESAMKNGRLQLHRCGGALKLLRHIGHRGVRQRLNLLHTRIRRMTLRRYNNEGPHDHCRSRSSYQRCGHVPLKKLRQPVNRSCRRG